MALLMGFWNQAGAQDAGHTCAEAGVITASGSYPFNTEDASADDPCNPGRSTVWFKFTATVDGTIIATLCDSQYDAALIVYEGPNCPVECNSIFSGDQVCDANAQFEYVAIAGTTYYFAINGINVEDFGTGRFDITVPTPISAGGTCATAGVIAENSSFPFDTTGASDDDPCAAGYPTVWYRFTAPSDGTVNADLCGSSFNTWLTAFFGDTCPASCTDFVTFNDDFCGEASAISFAATAGTTYHFAVSGANTTDFGPGVFNFQFAPTLGDTCDDPIEIVTDGAFHAVFENNTSFASADYPCIDNFRTVWYRFTAPEDGQVIADLCGSGYPPWLSVFNGANCPTCPNPDYVVSRGFTCDSEEEPVTFAVSAGQTYLIAVTGFFPQDHGPSVLDFNFIPSGPLLGDFNMDGIINVADVTAFSRWLRSDRDSPVGNVDVNGDGFLNELDVQALAEIIVND